MKAQNKIQKLRSGFHRPTKEHTPKKYKKEKYKHKLFLLDDIEDEIENETINKTRKEDLE